MLDTSPDISCPPETNIPALCLHLATVASLVQGAALSPERGSEPPNIPDAAIAVVRETVNKMMQDYLGRTGKTIFCDKSLCTARYVPLLLRIWPKAKFICITRAPMDMIASGMEACPWGLNGYGFDPYIAETPGNMIHALARYYAENTELILEVMRRYPEHCYWIRYEDLVEDPQTVMDGVLKFLGAATVPDIAEKCFAAERDQSGPADYKIWHTKEVHTSSVGRGWGIPLHILPPVLPVINQQCVTLGYMTLDERWGTAERPADPRVPLPAPAADGEANDDAAGDQAAPRLQLVAPGPVAASSPSSASASPALAGQPAARPRPDFPPSVRRHLEEGLATAGERFTRRWGDYAGESFYVVAEFPGAGTPPACLRVDLGTQKLRVVTDDDDDDDDVAASWQIIASPEVLDRVFTGQENISVAFRAARIRYRTPDNANPMAFQARLNLLSDLLGLASWGRARPSAAPLPHAGEADQDSSATG
jgi:hypothetical protein